MTDTALTMLVFWPWLTATLALLWWCLRPAKRRLSP